MQVLGLKKCNCRLKLNKVVAGVELRSRSERECAEDETARFLVGA